MHRSTLCLPLAACLALIVSCSDDTPGTANFELVHREPTTIVTIPGPDGRVTEDRTGDPELVGKKVARVQLIVVKPTELLNVTLTYWKAGKKASAETVEEVFNRSYEPSTGGIGVFVNLEIPGTENLLQCDGLYYSWTVSYRDEQGQPGTFNSQPRLIFPTKKLMPNGQVLLAGCVEPPGPEA